MVNSLVLVLMWYLSGTMAVFKPLGVKLCEKLYVSYGQCHPPLYVEQQLECYRIDTNTSSTKLPPHQPSPKRDEAKDFRRSIFSRTKKPVTIKRINIRKRPTVPKLISKTYKQVQVGEGFMRIKFHQEKSMNWSEARKVCQAEGGDLVKIGTKQKNDAIQNYLVKIEELCKIDPLTGCVWIGLSHMARNNTFVWTDGSPLIFSKWEPYEPSHKSGGDKDQDCVGVCLRWSDMECSNTQHFICEWNKL